MKILNDNKCPKCDGRIELCEIATELVERFCTVDETEDGRFELDRMETEYLDSKTEYYEILCTECKFESKVKLGDRFIQ